MNDLVGRHIFVVVDKRCRGNCQLLLGWEETGHYKQNNEEHMYFCGKCEKQNRQRSVCPFSLWLYDMELYNQIKFVIAISCIFRQSFIVYIIQIQPTFC